MGQKKGLFAELHERHCKVWMNRFTGLADNLYTQVPQAMAEMKKIFWQGTDHWDNLLTGKGSDQRTISAE